MIQQLLLSTLIPFLLSLVLLLGSFFYPKRQRILLLIAGPFAFIAAQVLLSGWPHSPLQGGPSSLILITLVFIFIQYLISLKKPFPYFGFSLTGLAYSVLLSPMALQHEYLSGLGYLVFVIVALTLLQEQKHSQSKFQFWFGMVLRTASLLALSYLYLEHSSALFAQLNLSLVMINFSLAIAPLVGRQSRPEAYHLMAQNMFLPLASLAILVMAFYFINLPLMQALLALAPWITSVQLSKLN